MMSSARKRREGHDQISRDALTPPPAPRMAVGKDYSSPTGDGQSMEG